MGRVSRYKRIKSCDPFYKGPKKDLDKGFNLPPNKQNSTQSMSRSFRDFLLYTQPPKKQVTASKEINDDKKMDKKRKKRSKEIDEIDSLKDDEDEDEEALQFKRRKGESDDHYLSRVNEETHKRLLSAHKKTASMSSKRKEYLKRRKLKAQLRKKGIRLDDAEGLDFDDLQDCIKFGEVAKAPPSLTPSVKNKKKAKGRETMSLKKQKDLEEEREKVIGIYRQSKIRTKN